LLIICFFKNAPFEEINEKVMLKIFNTKSVLFQPLVSQTFFFYPSMENLALPTDEQWFRVLQHLLFFKYLNAKHLFLLQQEIAVLRCHYHLLFRFKFLARVFGISASSNILKLLSTTERVPITGSVPA